jgi:hypothetical protein
VEQLGNDALDVRLGGIYALERIARDSERDQPTVVEVLSALIREHSSAEARHVPPTPATDVQAAVTVMGRLPKRPDLSRGDLSGPDPL